MEELGKITYTCDKCDFVTKLSNCLTRHDRVKHCDVSYNCEVCNKEYKTPHIKLHRRVHEGFTI